MHEQTDYWFYAKRYGWGWGLPCAWQGWLAYAAYALLISASFRFFELSSPEFFIAILVNTVLLIFVCWKKGEPPRWRWGK